VIKTAEHDFTVETVVDGLVHPFSMAFTPDGDMLVTERPGRLRIVRKGALLPKAVEGLPEILSLGHGGTPQDGREQHAVEQRGQLDGGHGCSRSRRHGDLRGSGVLHDAGRGDQRS